MPVNQEWFAASDCGPKCRSRDCVEQLNAVITKANLLQVKAFVKDNCPSSTVRSDPCGRFPIHIAASCGKTEVLDWLISTFQCDLNGQDAESGWSALHYAMYCGRLACAVLLVEYGANMWLRDKEGLTPMDLSTLDCTPWVKHLHFSRNTYEMPCVLSSTDPSEVYTWGVNDNFVVGHRNLKGSKLPESIEFFGKRGIFIKQVAVAKFHSVFVSKSGSVFACGHGEGGRLGNGHQDACLEPTMMTLSAGVEIASAATGLNSTALVTTNGQLLMCGLNRHHVLGLTTSSDREVVPVRVYGALKRLKVVGCAAAALHTVAWTDNGAVYTFGTNAGQLGHAKGGLYVNHPRQVSGVYNKNDGILSVEACDTATVVATKLGTIYLLQNYVCRKIITKQLDIEKVQVGGGRLDVNALSLVDQRLHTVHTQLKEDSLHVILRKKSGDVLSWSKAHSTLDRCRFNLPKSFLFKDVALCNHGHTALFITNMGQAFIARYGSWRPAKPSRRSSGATPNVRSYDSYLDMLDSDAVQEFTLEQVSSTFRAHTGVLGPEGKVGAVLQTEPKNFLTEVPSVGESEMQKDMTMLWESGGLHDLVIIATDSKGNKLDSFKCHKYILSSRSSYLRKLLSQSDNGEALTVHGNDPSTLFFQNCDPAALKNTLELIYCNSCQLCRDGYRPPALAKGINANAFNIAWSTHSNMNTHNGVGHVDEESMINGNISAYNVSQNQSKNKKGKKESNAKVCSMKNVLSVFKFLVKKLGIQDAAVESLTLDNGAVRLKKDVSIHYQEFSRHKFRNLYDIKLECSDGALLDAHKCILVARVEFFRSMLLSHWAERSAEVSRVSVPSEVFKHVLEYIYSDSSLALGNVSSLEILCEVMAAADQLLITRLKEMVEVQVASMLSLKNVSSIIEFASAFHCKQLQKTCQQFICHHLPALMHTPHFYSIEYSSLEEAEDYYRSNIDGVYMRTVTPDSRVLDLPDVEDVDASLSPFEPSSPTEEPFPWSSDGSASPNKKLSMSSRRKSIGSKKKSIPKSSSYGVTLSELLSRCDEKVDVLLDQITSSSIQPTLPEKLALPESAEKGPCNVVVKPPFKDPCCDTPSSKSKHPAESSLPASKSMSQMRPKPNPATHSFKDIVASEQAKSQNIPLNSARTLRFSVNPSDSPWQRTTCGRPEVSTGNSGMIIPPKSKKLSQKQRKKLAQETARMESEMKVVTAVDSPPVNAWGVASSPPSSTKSFWDVVKEQSSPPELKSNPVPNPSPVPRASSPVKQVKSLNGSPWQSVSKEDGRLRKESSSFRDIMRHEHHESEWALKQRNKPMHIIQLEDRAMAEMKEYYEKTVPPIDGQYFTVERLLQPAKDL